MRRLKNFLLATLCFVTLVGCAGTMQGVVRGTGDPVTFNYEQGMSSDKLTASIDGESFQGKAVMRGASSFSGNVFGNAGQSAALFGSATTGDIVAVLIGNRGSTLNCQLQYADSSGFTTAGGVGVCQHSDGRLIDVIW